MRILTATLLALAAGGASAQGFVPMGGYDSNCHFVLEPSVAGAVKTENAILSHGAIPALSLYTSAIESVYDAKESLTATVAADGASVTVAGLTSAASYEIFAADGILMAAGTVTPGASIALPGTAAAYILRVSQAGKQPQAFRLLKK